MHAPPPPAPFPSPCFHFLLKKMCHVDLVKSTFDLMQTFSSDETLCFSRWDFFGLFFMHHQFNALKNIWYRIYFLNLLMNNFVFFTEFGSHSCLSGWREIYDLTKVKQVRRRMTSCHPRSCLLSAPSNTDTPPRTLLSTPLNPPTAPSLGPPSVHGRRKKERAREGWRKGWTKFLEAQHVWSPTPFGNKHGNSEVSFIVFSSFYGLHVCRWALEWNETIRRQIVDDVQHHKQVCFDIQVSCLIHQCVIFIVVHLHLFVLQWCRVFFK